MKEREPLKCGKCGAVIPNAPGDTLDYAWIAKCLGGKVYCPKCEGARGKAFKAMAGRAR
jgi:hypothetical protein